MAEAEERSGYGKYAKCRSSGSLARAIILESTAGPARGSIPRGEGLASPRGCVRELLPPVGTAAYFIFVAVPSATNCKLFGNKQSDEEYNSFPWERSANIFGKVTLDEVDYTQGSEYLYFIYTIITHGN